MRLRRELTLTAVIALALPFTSLVGSATGAGTDETALSSPPAALVRSLHDLDKQLDSTIKKAERGDLKGEALAAVALELNAQFGDAIVANFPTVFGVAFSSVFFKYAGIDQQLENARAWGKRRNETKTAAAVDSAKSSLSDLYQLLTTSPAQGVPPGLVAALETLGTRLDGVAAQVRAGSLSGNALDVALVGVEDGKRRAFFENNPGLVEVFDQDYTDLLSLADHVTLDLVAVEAGLPPGQLLGQKDAIHRLRSAKSWKEEFLDALVRPKVSRIGAVFIPAGGPGACEDTAAKPNHGETCYGVAVKTRVSPDNPLKSFDWKLVPPVQDPTCTKFHGFPSKEGASSETGVAVWHHGDEDNCSHLVEVPGIGHPGTVQVFIRDRYWRCAAIYVGTSTNTNPGGPPPVCVQAGRVIVTVVKVGQGTVTSTPAGISCGTECTTASAGFAYGSQLTLSGSPGSSSSFIGWNGGGCSGTGDCSLTLNDRSVVVLATFAP